MNREIVKTLAAEIRADLAAIRMGLVLRKVDSSFRNEYQEEVNVFLRFLEGLDAE